MKKLLRLAQVQERTGLSRTQIYVKAQRGEFPQSVKIGERAAAWLEAEVDGWIAERVAERDTAGA